MIDIEVARERLKEAKAARLEALRQDSERPEGSGAQKRRNDERLQRLADAEAECERALEKAIAAQAGSRT